MANWRRRWLLWVEEEKRQAEAHPWRFVVSLSLTNGISAGLTWGILQQSIAQGIVFGLASGAGTVFMRIGRLLG